MQTVRLLQALPDVAEHYRRRFRHVLVDEYQDTNHAQYVLVRELTQGTPGVEPAELCVVGDADQSIYAFRGATIRNILDFEEDYPDATTILLEQNYRSTQTILTAANAVIARNPRPQAEAALDRRRRRRADHGYVADNEHDEAAFVARDDRRAARRRVVRALATSRCSTAPTRSPGCSRRCSSGSGCPTASSAACASTSARRCATRWRTCGSSPTPTTPCRCGGSSTPPGAGIGDRAEACLSALAERERIPFAAAIDRADQAPGINPRSLVAVEGFRSMIEALRTLVEAGSGPATVLEAVYEQTGLVTELQASSDPQDETRVENLRELEAVAREFEEANPDGTLGDFLEQVSLVADADDIPDADAHGGVVTLDDAAHRQGPGVPRRLPHRAGGRRLPAHAVPRRRRRSSRRSAGWPTSASPGPGSGSTSRGRSSAPPSASRPGTRPRASSTRCPRSCSPGSAPSRSRARAAARRRRRWRTSRRGPARSRRATARSSTSTPGDRVTHDTFGLGTVVSTAGVAEKRRRRSTSATTA